MRIGCNSNTTLVKVKYQLDILEKSIQINSNTTLVKVKCNKVDYYQIQGLIQIQHLLKLNTESAFTMYINQNSNTTLVKVKS